MVFEMDSSQKHGKHTWGTIKTSVHCHHVAPVAHSWLYHIKYGLAHCKSIQSQLLILFESPWLKIILGLIILLWHYIPLPVNPDIPIFYRLSNIQQLCNLKLVLSQRPKWCDGLTPPSSATEHLHCSCPTPFFQHQHRVMTNVTLETREVKRPNHWSEIGKILYTVC